MTTLSESLNFSNVETQNSHKIRVSETESIAAYDTLCLICAELDIDTDKYDSSDFSSASIALEDAYLSRQDEIKERDDTYIDLYVSVERGRNKMSNTIRVQIKNKCNSALIAELSEKATLIKRTGVPQNEMIGHLGCNERYNKNQGLATFDIDDSLMHLVSNDSHVLIDGKRISAKKYKANH
jgi:hypothetical protein